MTDTVDHLLRKEGANDGDDRTPPCDLAFGIWVPSAPGSVPGLTQPGEARMRMMDNDASTGMNEMKPATPMDHDSEQIAHDG